MRRLRQGIITASIIVVSSACGKSSAPEAPSPQNRAPGVTAVAVSPGGTGMAGATPYAFSATGVQDPDGNPITYAWTFGDGQTSTGATPTHVYQTPGSFAVGLTVSDGTLSTSAPSTTVVVGPSLTSVGWVAAALTKDSCTSPAACNQRPNVPQLPPQLLKFSQSGTTLTGTVTAFCNGPFALDKRVDIPLTGTVSGLTYPATLQISVTPHTCLGTAIDTDTVLSGVSLALGASASATDLSGTATMFSAITCADRPFDPLGLGLPCHNPLPGPIRFERCPVSSNLATLCGPF